ncbi:hypothetical protein LRR81_02660 [Metabacillus sp. GX 13764]|uniref:YqgU-like beta propeller domain-containing protein n=1 Tax=Metabacillus kandeliae TaxID=2900151 RepID=UPI001E588586|nr:hypothetical protein [Metabacillus kandeliae]MCD7033116.1 hypothetical protein [Metabacillus kandeliae]
MKEKKGKRIRITAGASLLLTGVLLAGCSQVADPKEIKQHQAAVKKDSAPLSVRLYETTEKDFGTVSGWLDSDHVLVEENAGNGGSNLFSYSLSAGKKEKLYASSSKLASVKINPQEKLLLLQASSGDNKSEIIVINEKGETLYKKAITAFQLDTSWNRQNPDLLYATAFKEDWTFQTHLLHPLSKKEAASPVAVPFVEWEGNDALVYIKWDQNDPQIQAPLYQYALEQGTEIMLKKKAVKQEVFGEVLLTVSMEDEKSSTGTYTFFNWKTGKELASMKAPLISNYSEWQVPNYALNEQKQLFYTFRQNSSQTFDLIAFSLKDQKVRTVKKGLENQPISLSPDGNTLLYGPRFEQLVDLQTQKVLPLVKYDKMQMDSSQ